MLPTYVTHVTDYKMYETMQRITCYLELFNREGRCLLLVEPLKYMGVEWLWVLCNHQLAVYPGIEFEDSPRPLQIPSSLYAALVTCLSQDEWPGPCTSNHQGETIKPVIDSVEITLDFVILYYEIILFIT